MDRTCSARFLIIAMLAGPLFGAPVFSQPVREVGADQPFVIVLGIAQDAGYPQANCRKACCRPAWDDPAKRRRTVSLGIVDPGTGERWLIDATPDFRDQLRALNRAARADSGIVSGILLTHAHIGHYTGLIHLGREVIGAKSVPVYAMPRMRRFLSGSGPWDQLIRLKNIEIRPLKDRIGLPLNAHLRVRPFLVPHRDEYSETVGFEIIGPQRRVVFIPDIDKWERWSRRIEEVVAASDRAYLDGTFFDAGELPGRNMAEIPHPFIVESMQRFAALPAGERAKISFIHFNHTNPVLQEARPEGARVRAQGFRLAAQGEIFKL